MYIMFTVLSQLKLKKEKCLLFDYEYYLDMIRFSFRRKIVV